MRALADICHRKGAALVVDAYQSIGAVPFDVHSSGVDFLAGGFLKWLMGGPGLAFLYVRRDRIEAHRPTALGWWAMEDVLAFDVQHLDLARSARRFEYGTPAVAAVATGRAGLSLALEVGIATVRERHMRLSQRLLEGALAQGWRARCPTDARARTSIVTLEHPDPQLAVRELRSRGIVCDARPRPHPSLAALLQHRGGDRPGSGRPRAGSGEGLGLTSRPDRFGRRRGRSMGLGMLLGLSSAYLALVGLGFLVVPDAIMFGTVGAGASPALIANLRGVSSTFLGIAVLNWFARGAGPSPARNAIVLANTVGFAIAGILDIVAVLGGAPTVQIAPAIINVLFAAAFAWSGRTSMGAAAA